MPFDPVGRLEIGGQDMALQRCCAQIGQHVGIGVEPLGHFRFGMDMQARGLGHQKKRHSNMVQIGVKIARKQRRRDDVQIVLQDIAGGLLRHRPIP